VLRRIFPLIAAALLLSACAFGNEYNYTTAQVSLGGTTDKSVSAAVVDRRPYVLNGDKDADFVGLQRGGFGNPFDVTTENKQPLAADLTDVLKRGLEARGISAQGLVVPAGTSLSDILTKFRAQGTDRLLLITMTEWKTDAMMRLTLHWNLEAAVYDAAGTLLGQNSSAGTGAVGGSGFEGSNSTASSQQVSLKLDQLLNDPAILDALK